MPRTIMAGRRGDDEVAEPQAGADDRAHEGPGLGGAHSSPLMLYSVPSSSGAATVTTAAPSGGPRQQDRGAALDRVDL